MARSLVSQRVAAMRVRLELAVRLCAGAATAMVKAMCLAGGSPVSQRAGIPRVGCSRTARLCAGATTKMGGLVRPAGSSPLFRQEAILVVAYARAALLFMLGQQRGGIAEPAGRPVPRHRGRQRPWLWPAGRRVSRVLGGQRSWAGGGSVGRFTAISADSGNSCAGYAIAARWFAGDTRGTSRQVRPAGSSPLCQRAMSMRAGYLPAARWFAGAATSTESRTACRRAGSPRFQQAPSFQRGTRDTGAVECWGSNYAVQAEVPAS